MKRIIVSLLLYSHILYSEIIDFNYALQKALTNNEALKAKKLNIDKAREDVSYSNLTQYGNISLNHNISKSNNPLYVFGMKLGSREASFRDFGFNEFLQPLGQAIGQAVQGNALGDISNLLSVQPNDLNNPSARTNFETKVIYEIPLFTGFKIKNAKDMAILNLQANKVKFESDKQTLALEVLKAYNAAVTSKYFIEATKKAKIATTSFVNFASEMYKEGFVTELDIEQAKVYDLNIDIMVLEAQNKFDLAIAYLKFLTRDSNISDVQNFYFVDLDNRELNILQTDSLIKRNDLKYVDYNTQILKKKINFEKASSLPSVGLHFEYGFNDDTFKNIDSDKDYYVGAIGIKYNLFDGGYSKNGSAKAKLDFRQLNHLKNIMIEGIKLEVEKAYIELATKKAVVKQKEKMKDLANAVLEKSKALYKNQLIKMNDLLLEQANAQKAEAQAIFAKYEEIIASAKLKIAIGEEL